MPFADAAVKDAARRFAVPHASASLTAAPLRAAWLKGPKAGFGGCQIVQRQVGYVAIVGPREAGVEPACPLDLTAIHVTSRGRFMSPVYIRAPTNEAAIQRARPHEAHASHA